MINLEKDALYPLLFEPAYKSVFWGGSKLRTVLNRDLPEDAPPIGEAWDICDRPNVSSTVVNGPLAGLSLSELLETYGCDLAGRNFQGGAFPIIVKIIDATKRISLQVHPTEQFCREQNSFCESKTEMWFVLQSDPGARIYAGLKPSVTRQRFLDHIHDNEIENLLQSFDSIPGDAYCLPPGRVHSLGAGNLIIEISQNSDTTFRISDWNRVDETGERRNLNVRDAVACMDFIDRTVPRICGASNTTDHNRKYPLINRCPFFRCDELMLVENWRDTTDNCSSFHILTSVNRPFNVGSERAWTRVGTGRSVLIPACFENYLISVDSGVETDIIRTTLNLKESF